MAQMVEHLTTMRETPIRSLGWEDPLEKEMATHSSTLAWKIPWTEEHGRLQSMGSQRVGHDSDFTFTFLEDEFLKGQAWLCSFLFTRVKTMICAFSVLKPELLYWSFQEYCLETIADISCGDYWKRPPCMLLP